jgi:hypothetical protein
LTEVGGVTLTEIAGDIYKEDLVYLLAQQRFKLEAQTKWADNSDNSGKRVVKR